jgi:hypothetical protein
MLTCLKCFLSLPTVYMTIIPPSLNRFEIISFLLTSWYINSELDMGRMSLQSEYHSTGKRNTNNAHLILHDNCEQNIKQVLKFYLS